MKIVDAVRAAVMLTEGDEFTIGLIIGLAQDILADAGEDGVVSNSYVSARIFEMRACGEVVAVGKEVNATVYVLTAKAILNQQKDNRMVTISKSEYNALLDQGLVIARLQQRINELVASKMTTVGPRLNIVGGVVTTSKPETYNG